MESIDVEELENLSDPLIVDVRSPSEYEEDHLPGAVNLPVLSDVQRDRVGTIYHQESTFRARREGAKEICRNAPEIIDEIDRRIERDRPVLVYCWRGGQRSQSLSLILDRIGYNIYRLEGGYKAYRGLVHEYFQDRAWSSPLVTIYGFTGAGKTLLLEILREKGETVVDLEGAANHRGSAFGGIGLDDQPSQKTFERRLYQEIAQQPGPIFVEGESRKIGRRTIPDPFFDELIEPPGIWLETSLDLRVQRIRDEYPWPECRSELVESVGNLKERLGSTTVEDLQEKLRSNRLEDAIQILLEKYYDPAYEQSSPDPSEYDLQVDGDNLQEAARTLIQTYSA